MQFRLTITCSNAAFGEYAQAEVSRILREAAKRIEKNGLPDYAAPLLDINGNRVGMMVADEEEPA